MSNDQKNNPRKILPTIVTVVVLLILSYFIQQMTASQTPDVSNTPLPAPTQAAIQPDNLEPPSSPTIEPKIDDEYPIHTAAPDVDTTLYKVTKIVDGDTIYISYNGKGEKVRFIGLNCPENTSKIEPFGQDATDYTSLMLLKKYVMLEFDEEQRDVHGRFLAYVYIDGKLFNEMLVRGGYADSNRYPPNLKYTDVLESAEAEARLEKCGMWALDEYKNRK